MHTYIHTYVRTYIYTYIHSFIHTYIRAPGPVQVAGGPRGVRGRGPRREGLRSVFKISCLLLRPRPWQFEVWDSTDKWATYLLLGFKTLNLKFCDLKLYENWPYWRFAQCELPGAGCRPAAGAGPWLAPAPGLEGPGGGDTYIGVVICVFIYIYIYIYTYITYMYIIIYIYMYIYLPRLGPRGRRRPRARRPRRLRRCLPLWL